MGYSVCSRTFPRSRLHRHGVQGSFCAFRFLCLRNKCHGLYIQLRLRCWRELLFGWRLQRNVRILRSRFSVRFGRMLWLGRQLLSLRSPNTSHCRHCCRLFSGLRHCDFHRGVFLLCLLPLLSLSPSRNSHRGSACHRIPAICNHNFNTADHSSASTPGICCSAATVLSTATSRSIPSPSGSRNGPIPPSSGQRTLRSPSNYWTVYQQQK